MPDTALIHDFNSLNRQAYDRFAHTYEKITAQGNLRERKLQKQLLSQFVELT